MISVMMSNKQARRCFQRQAATSLPARTLSKAQPTDIEDQSLDFVVSRAMTHETPTLALRMFAA